MFKGEIMRNSSIILSIIGLSVLVFGVIASQWVKNQQVVDIATLFGVGLIGVSSLLGVLSTPSEAQTLDKEHTYNEDYRVVWDRLKEIKNECEDTSANTNRWYDTQLDDIYRRIDELETKRK
jgi:hypothetical protein